MCAFAHLPQSPRRTCIALSLAHVLAESGQIKHSADKETARGDTHFLHGHLNTRMSYFAHYCTLIMKSCSAPEKASAVGSFEEFRAREEVCVIWILSKGEKEENVGEVVVHVASWPRWSGRGIDQGHRLLLRWELFFSPFVETHCAQYKWEERRMLPTRFKKDRFMHWKYIISSIDQGSPHGERIGSIYIGCSLLIGCVMLLHYPIN